MNGGCIITKEGRGPKATNDLIRKLQIKGKRETAGNTLNSSNSFNSYLHEVI